MSRSRPLQSLVLALIGCALGALAANAAQSLPEALHTLDAKYLEVPQIDANEETPKIEAGDWEEEAPVPDPQEIERGPVRVTLTYRESTDEDDMEDDMAESATEDGVTENTEDSGTERASEGEIDVAAAEQQISRIPIVTVFAGGEEGAKLEGDPGSADPSVADALVEVRGDRYTANPLKRARKGARARLATAPSMPDTWPWLALIGLGSLAAPRLTRLFWPR